MKKAWLAAVLNLIPGLGYVYLDIRRLLGWFLIGASIAFVITDFDPSLNVIGPKPEGIWILWYALAYLLPYAAFIIDGYIEAKKINAGVVTKKVNNMPTKELSPEERIESAVISPRKFALFSLITLGLYQVYWVWRAWEIVRQSRGGTYKFKSSLRAIVLEFTNFSLFLQLHKLAKKQGDKTNVDPVLTAGLYLVFWFVVSALSRLVRAPYGLAIVLISPLISALILVPILKMQNTYVLATKGKFVPVKANWGLAVVLAASCVLTCIVMIVAAR